MCVFVGLLEVVFGTLQRLCDENSIFVEVGRVQFHNPMWRKTHFKRLLSLSVHSVFTIITMCVCVCVTSSHVGNEVEVSGVVDGPEPALAMQEGSLSGDSDDRDQCHDHSHHLPHTTDSCVRVQSVTVKI